MNHFEDYDCVSEPHYPVYAVRHKQSGVWVLGNPYVFATEASAEKKLRGELRCRIEKHLRQKGDYRLVDRHAVLEACNLYEVVKLNINIAPPEY